MTRWQPSRIQSPSYFEHAAKLRAHGGVIFGPHLDLDPEDRLGLVDPFRMARRFAHTMALETGEPFAWGWYHHGHEGLRPAVCAVEQLRGAFLMNGRTDRPGEVTP
jgi:hypothetical protein